MTKKKFARNTSVCGICAESSTKGNSTMKTFICLLGVILMLGLASCASEPATTTTTTTHETTTVAQPTATQQTTTTYRGH